MLLFGKSSFFSKHIKNLDSKPGFVRFKASTKDTPALKGYVQPYEFILPPTWKQLQVANTFSGNYCQPKYAEPWLEVKFEDTKQGSLQVVASPMLRLTNKPNAKLQEIGNPDRVIAALTENNCDHDEVVESSILKRDGQTFYSCMLETPYAKTGSHNFATAVANGSVVLLFVVSANDAQ